MSGRLTVAAARALRHDGKRDRPDRFLDGGGLYLQVTRGGAKSWLFRYKTGGREREMGLGPFGDPPDAVPLAEARRRAAGARAVLADGRDPLVEREAERARLEAERRRAGADTFEAVAERMLAEREHEWSNPKHRQQVRNTLATYAYPKLGRLPVATVGADEVEAALRPIWRTKPETAGRLRTRILAVLRYARAHGLRPPPAPSVNDIAEALGDRLAKLGAMKRAAGYGHHPALDWREAPPFMAELAGRAGMSALALRFVVLTAARTGEVLGATWREVDREARIWTVPAARMKARREHRVPLSDAALAVLDAVAPLAAGPDAYVFPGAVRGRPLSAMSLTMLLRGMCGPDKPGDPPRWRDIRSGRAITAHGMRSTFRDWTAEATGHPREVAEAALAHMVGNDVEAAYQRGDLLAKRARLMADWADYLDRPASKGE